jgi:hypothetical protein
MALSAGQHSLDHCHGRQCPKANARESGDNTVVSPAPVKDEIGAAHNALDLLLLYRSGATRLNTTYVV